MTNIDTLIGRETIRHSNSLEINPNDFGSKFIYLLPFEAWDTFNDERTEEEASRG